MFTSLYIAKRQRVALHRKLILQLGIERFSNLFLGGEVSGRSLPKWPFHAAERAQKQDRRYESQVEMRLKSAESNSQKCFVRWFGTSTENLSRGRKSRGVPQIVISV